MLKLEILKIGKPGAEVFVDAFTRIAKAAGFQSETGTTGRIHEPSDGVLLLLPAGSWQDHWHDEIAEHERKLQWRAVAVAHADLHAGAATSVEVAAALQPLSCFAYPHQFDLRQWDGNAGYLTDWLAGYSKFVAAIKMWRSLADDKSAASNAGTEKPKLNHINILAKDLKASLAFYSDVFGANYSYNLGPKKVVMNLNGFDFFIEESPAFAYPTGYHIGVRAVPSEVKRIAELVAARGHIKLVKGNGPAPGFHRGLDNVRTAVYFEDPDGLVVEVYSAEVEMIETNDRLTLDYV